MQERTKRSDFLRLQQVIAATAAAADSQTLQGALEMAAHTAGRPQKNHNILRLHRLQLPIFSHRHPGFQHLLNLPGHIIRLFPVGILPDFNSVKRNCLRNRFMGDSLPERFRISIMQSAHPGCHAGREHIIYRLNHFRPGSEIMT